MPRILCDAVPFCFGPTSKMISVAEHLKGENTQILLLASGTSKELGSKSKLFRVIDCNSERQAELEKHRELFKKADLFVTVMNPVSAKFAQKLKKPTIYIDSLFWMWDKIPNHLYDVDKYFIQNFYNSQKTLQKYTKIKNAEIVGPIIDDSKPIEKNKHEYIVVNFGGMESTLIKIGKNSSYPLTVGKIIEEVLTKANQKAYFCGNDKVLKKFLNTNSKNIIISGRNHKDFLELLRKSKLLITVPGLTTTFEAFYYETPVAFLPPQNYSQLLNLDIFRKKNLAKNSFQWSDIYPHIKIQPGENEKKSVEKVLKCIKKFESDKTAQKKFRNYLTNLIQLERSNSTIKQKQYLNSLGENSAKNIANYILEKCMGSGA